MCLKWLLVWIHIWGVCLAYEVTVLHAAMPYRMNQAEPHYQHYFISSVVDPKEIKDYPGKWEVKLHINGALAKTESFTLAASAGPEAGEQTASKAEQMRKDQAKRLYEEGNTWYEAGQYRDAVESYRNAIKLEPRFAPLFYNLAMAHMELGQKTEAAAGFKRYLELRPDAPNATDVRALIVALDKGGLTAPFRKLGSGMKNLFQSIIK